MKAGRDTGRQSNLGVIESPRNSSAPLHQLSRKGRRNPLGWGGGWELLGSYLRANFLVSLPESF